jgi:hypothetical protein
MARFRAKPFAPKPMSPGATIAWDHTVYSEGTGSFGGVVRRTGVVWSKAPLMDGRDAVWVTPDVPLPDDLHYALIVTLSAKRMRTGPEPRLISSDDERSTTGYHTARAAHLTKYRLAS